MKKETQSNFRFKILFIDISFSNKENRWERLIYIVLALLALVGVFLILRQWIAPTLFVNKLSQMKISDLVNLIKSK